MLPIHDIPNHLQVVVVQVCWLWWRGLQVRDTSVRWCGSPVDSSASVKPRRSTVARSSSSACTSRLATTSDDTRKMSCLPSDSTLIMATLRPADGGGSVHRPTHWCLSPSKLTKLSRAYLGSKKVRQKTIQRHGRMPKPGSRWGRAIEVLAVVSK